MFLIKWGVSENMYIFLFLWSGCSNVLLHFLFSPGISNSNQSLRFVVASSETTTNTIIFLSTPTFVMQRLKNSYFSGCVASWHLLQYHTRCIIIATNKRSIIYFSYFIIIGHWKIIDFTSFLLYVYDNNIVYVKEITSLYC